MIKERNSDIKKDGTATIDIDFQTFVNRHSLPIPVTPSRIPLGLVIRCRTGTCRLKIAVEEHLFVENELIVIIPNKVVSMVSCSSDFKADYFTVSVRLFNDILSGMIRLSPRFFLFMRQHYFFRLNHAEQEGFDNYFTLLCKKKDNPGYVFRRDVIISLLRVLYLDVYNFYMQNVVTEDYRYSRKEELAHRFFLLIMDHYKDHKDVSFYADKLCITPKYLTMVVREISGQSAKDWIANYLMVEIKSLLRMPSLDIQEIVTKVNFTDLSSLGRFFRRHAGMSPSQYRKLR